jgi:hypothetical protein
LTPAFASISHKRSATVPDTTGSFPRLIIYLVTLGIVLNQKVVIRADAMIESPFRSSSPAWSIPDSTLTAR